MVNFSLSSIAAVAVSAAVIASSVQAAPLPAQNSSMDKRVVGTLHCSSVKKGTLSLYNTDTKQRKYVTIANNYSINKAAGSAPLLSSYNQVKKSQAQFEFLACKEDNIPNRFEDFPPYGEGTYFGHLSPINGQQDAHGNPALCATHVSEFADSQFLAAEKCYYSDDSGSPKQYFTYQPGKDGQINFLGYTGPEGGEPETANQKQSAYDFDPGQNAKHPAVFVHDGSKQFSSWILELH